MVTSPNLARPSLYQRPMASLVTDLCLSALTGRQRLPRDAAGMRACQRRILARLLDRLAPLPVGRQFGLDRLADSDQRLDDFRRLVPITTYIDYVPLMDRVARGERDVLFPGAAVALAQTSGTTSDAGAGERYVPQDDALLRHHKAGGAEAFARAVHATGLGIFRGKLLMLGGSTGLAPNAHGVPAGDLSGIIAARIPSWLRSFHEPGDDIAFETDWGRKIERIVARCAPMDLRLVSGIPSWMLVLFGVIERASGRPVHAQWPHLRTFIHGGHAIKPFIPRLEAHLHPDTWMMEVYPASEAFIAVGSRPWRLHEGAPPALELLTNHGVYLEFCAEDDAPENAVTADGIEAGRIYRVLLTTPAGLVRYQLGDLVLAEGPGLVRVAGRIKTRISVFGEHVEGHFLAEAVAAACAATRASVCHYHVAPVLPTADDPRGRHEWWVEFGDEPASPSAFAAAIDRYLCGAVIDYAAHRAGGQQLLEPRVVPVPTGTFDRFLASRGKLGGQHKIPQAWPDRTIADALNQLATPSLAERP